MEIQTTDLDTSWLEDSNWFHSIDYGNDLISRGRFSKKVPPNYTIYGVYELLKDIDLRDMTCMDIGTMDGIVALTLKNLGAKHVIATDMAKCETFVKGCELLNYEIEYKTPVRMDEIPELLGPQKLDLVVNAGILYHVLDPVETLRICRGILKKNGLLILETQYLFDERRPIMSFNPYDNGRRGNPNANTFWRAGKKTIEGMLELNAFKILSTVSVNGRFTVVAQACDPAQVDSKYPKMKNVHETYLRDEHYRERVDYDGLTKEKTSSDIKYLGERTDRFIFRSLYKSNMPFQPVWRTGKANKIKTFFNDLKFWISTKIARI